MDELKEYVAECIPRCALLGQDLRHTRLGASFFAACGVLSDFARSPVGRAAVGLVLGTIFVSEIFVGLLYQDECPAQPRIPQFLLVTGATQTLSLLAVTTASWKSSGRMENVIPVLLFPIVAFQIVWFISGHVWLIDAKLTPESPHLYCHRLLLSWTIGALVVDYIALVIGVWMFYVVVMVIISFIKFFIMGPILLLLGRTDLLWKRS